MANEQNLKPIKDSDVARALQEKSAKKKSENFKERKLIRQGLEEKLGMYFDDYITAILDKAVAGDTKAWELVRDTIGEKPIDKQEIRSEVPIIIDKVEK